MLNEGNRVTVRIRKYAPGQEFWEEPAIKEVHERFYLHSYTDGTKELHTVDTWTGAGYVDVSSESIVAVEGRNPVELYDFTNRLGKDDIQCIDGAFWAIVDEIGATGYNSLPWQAKVGIVVAYALRTGRRSLAFDITLNDYEFAKHQGWT